MYRAYLLLSQLCLKYPLKHRVLVGFLATFLREEGGFEFKKAITDCIVELMTAIPETKVLLNQLQLENFIHKAIAQCLDYNEKS